MMKIRQIALLALLSTVALQSGAWTLFGSKSDALADKLRSGDKYLQKADTAFEEGRMERAGKYYGRAIQKYEELKEADPTYMDGIAGIRLTYCAKQYTNALEAVAAAIAEAEAGAANAAEAGAPDGAEAGAAGAAEAGAAGAAEVAAAGAAEVAAAGAAEVAAAGAAEVGAANAAEVSKLKAAQPPKPQAASAAETSGGTAAETSGGAATETSGDAAAETSGDAAAQAAPPPRPPYDPRNFTHDFAEARMLMEDGNLSEAAAVLIPMLRHDPANRQVRLLLAIVRTRQSRYDEAIVALEDLRGIREDMPILLALSGAYMGAVRYHDALLTLDRAVRLNPADPNPYLNLAWLTLVMPQEPDTLKNAEIYYRQAVRRGATRDRALETRIGLTKW
jgi:tetratricopeptide (TPR) repeat protein